MIAAWVFSSTWPSRGEGPFVGEPNSVAQICLAPSPCATIALRTSGTWYQVRSFEQAFDGKHGYEYGWKLATSKKPFAP